MSTAISSSESPAPPRTACVIGSIAEMSSLKSSAKRITAQMPRPREQRPSGSPSDSRVPASARGVRQQNERAAASAAGDRRADQERRLPSRRAASQTSSPPATKIATRYARDAHRVGHPQLAAVVVSMV